MKIAARYRPYSRKAGTLCLLPLTEVAIKAFPTSLFIYSQKKLLLELHFSFESKITDFTVFQDLEERCVSVLTKTEQGFFSYKIKEKERQLVLVLLRAPSEGLKAALKKDSELTQMTIQAKETVSLCSVNSQLAHLCVEKISFGNHKAQEWESIAKRKNPKEFLPLWYALAQTILPYADLSNSLPYLNSSKPFLDEAEEIFAGFFDGMMLPKGHAQPHLGISERTENPSHDLFYLPLLAELFAKIRSFILCEKDKTIDILRELPFQLDAGRALNMKVEEALIDIEWSKKRVKKLKLTVFKARPFLFSFQNDLKTFRLKSNQSKTLTRCSCNAQIALEPGVYLLDQFQK